MSGQTILVVDDEPSISEVVTLYLRRAGYQVRVAHDGTAALAELEAALPDLVVLDLMLPGVDGMEITRRLRAVGDTPIIMLTARREETDRILGLEMGADDYVVKPFSPQELVSRVRAVLRRTAQPAKRDEAAPSQRALRFADLTVDPTTRLATVRGEEIVLTAKEFDLLWFLAGHPRQVFNRDQLLDNVWGETQYIDPSTVTVHVRRLREKLEADPSTPRHILTVWGVGYKFEP
ncbi:MAG: response regulator transcription factor [Caldilinea sp.]|nr:response regulator transcription factor [Caldilinea sp.]MCB0150361.1 response regulator transcription factor [Caldilineaceae bacterium]MCB9118221.1 response regulator transcription factor [Caldilineaceae bacterium]MCB9123389.1 response regulator transcription factor [Caldilineaceae bacterium]MCO5208384.1 response regulator transcription factor [Caldilinea sp.]